MDDPDGIFLCVLGLSVPVPFAVLCTALCLLIGLLLGSFHFFTPLPPLFSPFTTPFTGGMAQPLSDDPAIPLCHHSPPRLLLTVADVRLRVDCVGLGLRLFPLVDGGRQLGDEVHCKQVDLHCLAYFNDKPGCGREDALDVLLLLLPADAPLLVGSLDCGPAVFLRL